MCERERGSVRVCVYLQAHPDPLGERSLREHSLDLRHHRAAQDAPLRTNQDAVLLDARHHRKVLGEVAGDDAADPRSEEHTSELQSR